MAPTTTTFKPGDYLTNGVRLVMVGELVGDGDVLVEDAWTTKEDTMPIAELNDWRTVTPDSAEGEGL